MNWDTVQQLVRIVLQFLAGILVTKGIIDEANAVTLVGALVSLASVIWWAVWNKKAAPSST